MIPWLINNSCALALALNSTGKVIKAKTEDAPKRMTPTQASVGSCNITPAINSQEQSAKPVALPVRCTFAPPRGSNPPHPARHARLHEPLFQPPLRSVQSILPGSAAMSWNADRNDRSASQEWTRLLRCEGPANRATGAPLGRQ